MKTYYFFILLLFAVGCHTPRNQNERQAQTIHASDTLWTPTGNAQLDSLLQLAAVAIPDTNLAKLYYEIGEMYENTEYEKAKEYYQKLGNLSEALNWSKGRLLYASGYGLILSRELLTDTALVVFQQGLELAKSENNERWVAYLHISKGNAYFVKGWNETALAYYMEALPCLEKMNDAKHLQNVYYMLSQTYKNINADEKAIEYGEKSVALNSDDEYALYALAAAYSSSYQYEKSIKYYEEALRLAALRNNTYLTGLIYFYMANDAMVEFDLEKTEKYAHLTIEIFEQFGRPALCAGYIMFSKLEQAKGNYEKAENYAKDALQIAVELDALNEKLLCYRILSELAAAKHNYRENIQYWREFDMVEKDIAKETALIASEEMAAKYETEKKNLEIERQQLIISRSNMQRGMLAAGIAVFAVIVVLLWYMLRLRNRRNRTLADMNITKDKFFSIISHDLKNPAVAQRDALQILVNNTRLWDTDTLSEFANELLQSAEAHAGLIFNLLGWARLQIGRMTYTPDTFSLSSCFRSEIPLIRNMAEKKGIAFSGDIPDDISVTGDSNMLSTVIRNLLANAVKFTAAGGTVSLAVEPTTAGKYAVSVTDTGTGMTREQKQKLFRLDSAQSRTGTAGEHGSGLGLIVCKELLEKHGTTLHVESEKGKGSRFWFEV